MTKYLFEMKLADIHKHHPWLKYEISEQDFVSLFPVHYKNNVALKPEFPADSSLTREIFLQVLVAFSQCFTKK